MAVATSTYYGLTRVREMGPNADDWAVTDRNFEALSLILKQLENHHHTGTASFNFPGANPGDPTNPTLPTLTYVSSGGIMTPGQSVGVKLSYTDANGLETDSSSEQDLLLPAAVTAPLAPTQTAMTPASTALTGGTYIYALTKAKAGGETTISDVLPVSVPYDQTYSITLGFDAISTYTDGTTGLNVYRSNGQNAAFQLVGQISSTSAVTFVDTNTIAPGNQNVQPPSASSFNATYKVNIDFSAITFPSDAKYINVYVTRQAGIWGTSCLLEQIDLVTTPTDIDYLGSEALAPGRPKSGSELVTSPPKIDLANESNIGAIDLDFNNKQAKRFVVQNNAGVPTGVTPVPGTIYYDTTAHTLRAYHGTPTNGWVSWGTSTASAYTHPAREAGGHSSANIFHQTSGAVTLKDILDRIADATTGAKKQVTQVVVAAPTTTGSILTSTTPVTVADLSVTFTPEFNNQWGEIIGYITFQGDTPGMVIAYTTATTIGGVTTSAAARVCQISLVNQYMTVELRDLHQFPTGTTTVEVQWWVSGGQATAFGTSRGLSVKTVY